MLQKGNTFYLYIYKIVLVKMRYEREGGGGRGRGHFIYTTSQELLVSTGDNGLIVGVRWVDLQGMEKNQVVIGTLEN